MAAKKSSLKKAPSRKGPMVKPPANRLDAAALQTFARQSLSALVKVPGSSIQSQQGESIMSEATNTAKPKQPKPVSRHTFKPGTAAHTALLKSAGLAPATKEKPATKKPVVSK